MDKAELISGVAEDLYATEKAIDAALVQATAMFQNMMTARAELGLSAVTFSESQAKVMETLATLGEARAAIVATHQELAKDHRRMGWGVFAAGVGGDKGESGTPIQGSLKVVPPLRVAS